LTKASKTYDREKTASTTNVLGKVFISRAAENRN
jgi:hypothetical protein